MPERKPMADRAPLGADGLDGLMLAEHAHRVANDMAVAIAELEICRVRLCEAEASRAVAAVIDRLHKISGVQRRLMCPEEGRVGLHVVLGELAEAVASARAGRQGVDLVQDLTPLDVDARFAWKLAVIVAEALTNAFKHGLADCGRQVRLSLEVSASAVRCTVADDGTAPARPGTPGFGQGSRIMGAIAADLAGTVERVTSDAGTQVRISLPRPDAATRKTPAAAALRAAP